MSNYSNGMERHCQGCGTPMDEVGDGHVWWNCPNCHYQRGEFIGS